mgnify:CR=1 FL=1
MPKEQAKSLSDAIIDAKEHVRYCKCCYTLTDDELCPICKDAARDHKTIMVVENTRDLVAYEKTGKYEGVYHVLGGAIFTNAWHRSGGYSSEGAHGSPCKKT